MRAIILAAGRGSRLAECNNQRPKSLLSFDQESLMQRHLRQLRALGIRTVHLVVGYQARELYRHVGNMAHRAAVVWHENPRFEEGSVISLLCAQEALHCGEPVLIMDADVLYHPAILQRLADSKHDNVFLLDRDFTPGDEPVKICLKDGRIVEFRKRLADSLDYDTIGESVGFFRLAPDAAAWVAGRCRAYDQQGRGDQPHEEVLRDFALQGSFSAVCEDITGLPWIEIDFPEDVQRAKAEVLPHIK